MTASERMLAAFGAAAKNEHIDWTDPLSDEEWAEIFQLSSIHHVLPLVLEAVYGCPAIRNADPRILHAYRVQSIRQVSVQTQKTTEFLTLYRRLTNAGIRPLVVKGIVCRNLYPLPDHRISGDEDMLIAPGDYGKAKQVMEEFGMHHEGDENAYEVPFFKDGSALYIELHKSLFPPDSSAYSSLNNLFEDARDRAATVTIGGRQISTLSDTDHLLYLICHAFKHFLHSGFGVRQICDVSLFANARGQNIRWQEVLDKCRAIRAERFAGAMLRIGQRYFGFDPEKACLPDSWRQIETDEQALLEDALSSGVFGRSSGSRTHSSNITLNAVAADKQGKKASGSVLRTIFPPAAQLEKQFPYLKGKPWLLPVAWASRILKYGKQTASEQHNDAAESIRIGKERVALLRQYGIID